MNTRLIIITDVAVFSLLACFATSLFLPSCKKSIPEYYIRQELKEYSVFQNGSYWIYRNDSSGINDSAFVINGPVESMSGGGEVGRYEEEIGVLVNSNFFLGYFLGFQCNAPYNNDGHGYTDKLQLWIQFTDIQKGQILAIWPDQPLNLELPCPCHCPYGNCWYFTTEMIKDYSLNNNHFQNVLRTSLRTSDTTSSYPYAFVYDFYFAKQIGLIRMRENNIYYNVHRSYSLVRWYTKL